MNDVRQIAFGLNIALGVKTHKWRVMLMHTVYGNPIGRCFCSAGKSLAPAEVGTVAKPCPVDRTDYDRMPAAQQHETECFQRIPDLTNRVNPASTE